ncbi:DUF2470 domain-containing protein [Streptomyces zhihengii]
MIPAKSRVDEPGCAERVRSVIAAAPSLSLTADDRCYDLVDMHSVDRKGRLLLHAPADSPLAAQAAHAPRGDLAALLEFTDIAPTGVRDRVRAKVTLAGRLVPCDARAGAKTLVLGLDLARAGIERRGRVEHVDPEDLARARPDVLAAHETSMLLHLTDDHQDVVDRLALLTDPAVRQGALRVRPLALDRFGIVLRLEHAGGGHTDTRIAFPGPVRDTEDVGRQIDRLLRRPAPRRARHRP